MKKDIRFSDSSHGFSYGKWVALGIIALLGVVGGWQYLEHRSSLKTEEASNLYESVLDAYRKKQISKASEKGTELMQTYQQSPYAQLTALLLARIAFDQEKLDVATDYLQQAIQIGEKGPVLHIARVRLAKLLASQNKAAEALEILTAVNPPKEYLAFYEEAKGDVYVMQKDLEKARVAYKTAVKAAPEGVPIPWLQLKQNDLGDSNNSSNSNSNNSNLSTNVNNQSNNQETP